MGRADAQAKLARLKPRDPGQVREVGTKGVIAEDGLGQPIFAEGIPQHSPGGFHGQIGTRMEGHEEAEVVIEDRQGCKARAVNLDPSFEIELPQFVGLRSLEA